MKSIDSTACVAVVGAGAMGCGIAQVAARAGHDVWIYDAKENAGLQGRAAILEGLDRQVEKGRLTVSERQAVASRLNVATSIEDLGPAKLVIEAIVENLKIKQQVLSSVEKVVCEEAILASNTSSLSITAIGSALQRPERLAGLHFFNPAPVMKLVEIVAGLASDATVLATLFDTALAWGKTPVHATSTPGFIVNRVARPFYAEALRLLEERAADVATIDTVIREAGGFRMGPFELMDLIGHDVNAAVTRSVFDAYFGDPRFKPSLTQQELVAAGWLGRKTGRGFYHYDKSKAAASEDVRQEGISPTAVAVEGDLGPAEPLLSHIENAGIVVTRAPGEGVIRINGASLALSDGRTATARVAAGEPSDLVLFDLALDYLSTTRIALAKADQATAEALHAASGLFLSIGKTVSIVDDSPGLIVMRTVAMLANEASDALMQGVATAADIDRAMTLGVNYPRGPLAWADSVGPRRILTVMEALQNAYGDDRYRASHLLRRRVAAEQDLCPAPRGSTRSAITP